MNHKGIDVSTYQGNIDWKKVKAAGIEYAIIRAGYGNSAKQKDKCFDTNVKNAKAAGIKIGAYWFSYATSVAEAKVEADAFAEVIKGIEFELPIFYDYEYDSIDYAKKKGITITKKLASDIVIAFLDRMKAKGYSVANYVNPDLIQNAFDNRISKYDTWMAHYTKYIKDADIRKQYTYDGFKVIGWQYTGEGTVNGISGNVDMNVFYIDVKEPKKATISTVATTTTTASNTSTSLKAGQAVALSNTPIYNTASTASVASRRTGTYYLWDAKPINGRIRITNTAARVGVANQVTGWMNVSDVKSASTTTSKPTTATLKVGSKVKVKSGAKFYDGVQPAKFVYNTTYDVLSISGDKVVIGIGKAITGAIRKSDLIVR